MTYVEVLKYPVVAYPTLEIPDLSASTFKHCVLAHYFLQFVEQIYQVFDPHALPDLFV